MLNITKQEFSEVYDIIFNMELYNKIPKSFIELIDNNRDTSYKVNIDYSKSINEQELKKGTRVLLSLIYRDYLCNEEERQTLIKKDKEELKKAEEELRERYSPDNLFKNKSENKKENMQMVQIEKVSFWTKIINKILIKLKPISITRHNHL